MRNLWDLAQNRRCGGTREFPRVFLGFIVSCPTNSILRCSLRSVDGDTLQGDEDTIWKLVHAASVESADLAPILDKLRADDVVVDGSKTMSGDGDAGEAEKEVGIWETLAAINPPIRDGL